MKTEFEISSAISNYITSDEGVTDFPVSLKQISDEVDTLRVRIIEEMDEKGVFRRPFHSFTQTIEVDMKKDTSTNVRYIELPRLFFLANGKPAIAYCGKPFTLSNKPLFGSNFRIVAGNQREWFTSDKWIGKLPTAVVTTIATGNRIDLYNISANKLRLEAVFQDPSDLEIYGYNGDKTYNEGGSAYPLPMGEIDRIIGKTVESYLRTLYRHPKQANQGVDAPGQVKDSQ